MYDQHRYETDACMRECREHGTADGFGGYTQDDFRKRFKAMAFQICSNENELCDIVLDLCYQNESSKQFAWDIAGDVIIKNLLVRRDYNIEYPLRGGNDFEYQGEYFSMKTLQLSEDDIT